MFRLYFPFILIALALVWAANKYFRKADKSGAVEILRITAFFSLVWFSVYYFIFR